MAEYKPIGNELADAAVYGCGGGFLVSGIFATAKLFGVLDWSWIWVFAPSWILIALIPFSLWVIVAVSLIND